MQATIKDLHLLTRELLETVKRGEEVVITERGKPCAKLIPLESHKIKKKAADELFGIWKDHEEIKDVESYVRKLRNGRF